MNDNELKEITFNGVTYVRKDSIAEAKPTNTEGMQGGHVMNVAGFESPLRIMKNCGALTKR